MARYLALSLQDSISRLRSFGGDQSDRVHDAQQQHLDHEVGIFGAIQAGDLPRVLQCIEEDKAALSKRDGAGAAPIHAAFLYGKADLGKVLLQKYPECALHKYVGTLYTGENILHIAIVQRDVPLALWLLERSPQLLNAEATGHFFEPAGDAYFGGYPLLFAVSSNQPAIVERILCCDLPEAPGGLQNSVLLQDRFGNTALHMAVIHDLPAMYDFLLTHTASAFGAASAVDFAKTLNHQHLTPLALAAAMGRAAMFRHILDCNSRDSWEYGPIKCKLVPIWSLEQPRVYVDRVKGLAKRSKEKLALACICANAYQPMTNCLRLRNGKVAQEVEDGRLELAQVPEVQQLLDAKWQLFGKAHFYKKLVTVMGVQVLWVAGMVLPNHWRLDYDNVFNYPVSNGFIIAIEGVVLISALHRLFRELQGYAHKGWSHISHTHGAATLEKVLGTLFSVFYITSWILRLSRCLNEEDILASAAGLVGWCYSCFFLLGFRSTGPFIIMIMEIIMYDMRRIIVVWFSVLVAYTTALYLVLYWQADTGVNQYFQQMLYQVYATVGLFQSNSINSDWMPITLSLMFSVLVSILLINLLIAMMSATFSRVDANSEWRWCIEKANIMAAFEASLGVREMEQCRRRYAVPGGTVDDQFADLYLQVKVVDPGWKLQKACNSSSSPARSPSTVSHRSCQPMLPPLSPPPVEPGSPDTGAATTVRDASDW
eukprot:EG_transcript_3627